MGDIVEFSGETRIDLPPEKVLGAAMEADLEGVVCIGWTKNGDLYFDSSIADEAEILMLLALGTQSLLKPHFD